MTPSFQPYDQGRCLKALSVDNIKGFQDDLGHIVTRFLNINISSVTISFVVLKLMSLDQSGRGCAAFQQRTFDPERGTADQKNPLHIYAKWSRSFRMLLGRALTSSACFVGTSRARPFSEALYLSTPRELLEKNPQMYIQRRVATRGLNC